MKYRIIKTVLVAVAAWMFVGLSMAADTQPHKAAQASAAHGTKPPATKKASTTKKAPAPAPVPVDINSASREELKKLPGIGDAEADKIIAGRPFLTKAHLQTRNIVSPMAYQGLRQLVVARQKDAKFGKAAGK